ncbi:MAG: hypothetical protein LC623_02155, partial [Halobacteriales archaeon]|nr:hypothetical protein [Halobacteriales archaeon]
VPGDGLPGHASDPRQSLWAALPTLPFGTFAGQPPDDAASSLAFGLKTALESAKACHPVDSACSATVPHYLLAHPLATVTAADYFDDRVSATTEAAFVSVEHNWIVQVSDKDQSFLRFSVQRQDRVPPDAAPYFVRRLAESGYTPGLATGLPLVTLSSVYSQCTKTAGASRFQFSFAAPFPLADPPVIGGVQQGPGATYTCSFSNGGEFTPFSQVDAGTGFALFKGGCGFTHCQAAILPNV